MQEIKEQFTEQEIEENYNKFIGILKEKVSRPGIENLVNWLNKSDLKTAPASTKFHLSCKGGLVKHSLNVYERMVKLVGLEFSNDVCPYSEETIALVALMHDISKINYYEVQERNAKDEKGNWVKVPFYSIREKDKRLIFGSHSMNSLYMLGKFVKLNYEEELAVLHHMGGSDPTEDTLSCKNVYDAFEKSTLAALLHTADLLSTVITER